MFGEIHHCTHLSLMFCYERLLIIDSIYQFYDYKGAFLVAQTVKNLPAMQET